jgi:hypothetical protein
MFYLLFSWIFRKTKLLWGLMTGKVKMASKADTAIVCIGMEISKKYGACPGARLDSDAMSRILLNYGHVTLLQERAATVDTVSRVLKEALEKPLCILYYSGHGGQRKDASGEGGVSEYLCLDNGPLPDYKIWEMLQSAKGRVFMIFDCCHSETMYRAADGTGDTAMPINKGFKFQLLREMMYEAEDDSRNILVWSGCPADNYSYGDKNGGVFTNGIRKALISGATYDYVWERAEHYAKSQHPVRTLIGKGFDGPVFR